MLAVRKILRLRTACCNLLIAASEKFQLRLVSSFSYRLFATPLHQESAKAAKLLLKTAAAVAILFH
jgi:hypothetical protein